MRELPKFQVGDLVRAYTEDAHANTLYRVTKVKKTLNPSYGNQWDYMIIGVLGLFRSNFKLKKRIRDNGYEKVTLLELAQCRNALDQFIQQEAKRLSGEEK